MKEKNVLDMLKNLFNEIENLPESDRIPPDESVKKEETKLGKASSLVQQLFTIRNRLYKRVKSIICAMEEDNGGEYFYKEYLKFDALYDIISSLLWLQIREEFGQYEQEYDVGIRNDFMVVKFKEESEESRLVESVHNMGKFLEGLKKINLKLKSMDARDEGSEDCSNSFFIINDKIDSDTVH